MLRIETIFPQIKAYLQQKYPLVINQPLQEREASPLSQFVKETYKVANEETSLYSLIDHDDTTLLQRAVMFGETDLVKLILSSAKTAKDNAAIEQPNVTLSNDWNVQYKGSDSGLSAIDYATITGSKAMQKLLQEYGSGPSSMTMTSAFLKGLMDKNLSLIVTLIRIGAKINDIKITDPLHPGVSLSLFDWLMQQESPDPETLSFLLKQGLKITRTVLGVNVTRFNPSKISFFEVGIVYGKVNLVQYALRNNETPIEIIRMSNGESPIEFALKQPNVDLDILGELVEKRFAVNEYLIYAVENCGLDVLEVLLKSRRIDPNFAVLRNEYGVNEFVNAFHVAVIKGLGNKARALKNRGFDINKPVVTERTRESKSALQLALRQEPVNFFMVQYLLTNGITVQERRGASISILELAIVNNLPELAKEAIRQAKIQNVASNIDSTLPHSVFSPLMLAVCAEYVKPEMVKLLLDLGADVNIQRADLDGRTLLQEAIRIGDMVKLNLILDNPNIDVNLGTGKAFGALHEAVKLNNLPVLKKLIAKGANLNIHAQFFVECYFPLTNSLEMIANLLDLGYEYRNLPPHYFTPLEVAIFENKLELVNALILSNVDLSAVGKNGLTPLSLAKRCGASAEIIGLLTQQGALEAIPLPREGGKALLLSAFEKMGDSDVDEENGIKDYKEKLALDARTELDFSAELIAISTKNLPRIANVLLGLGANIHHKDSEQRNGLYFACMANKEHMITFYRHKGVKFNSVKDVNGLTAQHWFASMGNTYLLATALIESNNVQDRDNHGNTALMNAVKNNQTSCAVHLLEKGADVNARNEDGDSAIYYAIEEERASLLRLLVEKKAKLPGFEEAGPECVENQYRALEVAVYFNKIRLVRNLLSQSNAAHTQNDRTGTYPVLIAAMRNYPAILALLIEKGANVNDMDRDGVNALHAAVIYNSLDALKVILHSNNLGKKIAVNVHAKATCFGLSAIELAVLNNDINAVTELLLVGANINEQGSLGTLVDISLQSRSTEMLTFLLNKGADANKVAIHNMSPLYTAVIRQQWDLVKVLLEVGRANPLFSDANRRVPLYHAIKSGNLFIIDQLLAHGGDKVKNYNQFIAAARTCDIPEYREALMHLFKERKRLSFVKHYNLVPILTAVVFVALLTTIGLPFMAVNIANAVLFTGLRMWMREKYDNISSWKASNIDGNFDPAAEEAGQYQAQPDDPQPNNGADNGVDNVLNPDNNQNRAEPILNQYRQRVAEMRQRVSPQPGVPAPRHTPGPNRL